MQFILRGSKQFRKNGGPYLKGSRRPRKKVAIRPLLLRRPKVVFLGAQAEKNFFFFFRRRLVMVFGGQITFSNPLQNFRPPQFFFGPQCFFFGGFFVFSAPKTKNRLFRRAPKEQYFSAPKRKNLGFFFFFRRRLVMVFGGQITFSIPQKYFSAAFFFLGAPKNRRFWRPKPKIDFFGGRRRSKGLKVAFWVQPPYEPLAVKIVLRGSNGFRGFRGTHLEGPRRLRMKGS